MLLRPEARGRYVEYVPPAHVGTRTRKSFLFTAVQGSIGVQFQSKRTLLVGITRLLLCPILVPLRILPFACVLGGQWESVVVDAADLLGSRIYPDRGIISTAVERWLVGYPLTLRVSKADLLMNPGAGFSLSTTGRDTLLYVLLGRTY